MSKRSRIPDIRQLTLEDLFRLRESVEPAPEGGLDVSRQLVGLLAEALRKAWRAGRSREQVCDEISRLAGRPISIHMLNNYLGRSDGKEGYRFPADLLLAFCQAVGDLEPLEFLARALGRELVEIEVLAMAKIGELRLQRDRLTREEREWKRRLETRG
jgi:hypothetical protein